MLPVSILGVSSRGGSAAAAGSSGLAAGVSGALGVVSGIVMMRAVRGVASAVGLRRSASALAVSIMRALPAAATGSTEAVAIVVTRSSRALRRACEARSSAARWSMVLLRRPRSPWISVTVRRTVPISASALLAACRLGSGCVVCWLGVKRSGCHAREAR